MADKYCVVISGCDEDGPFDSGTIFHDLKEAIEYADDLYGSVYKLVAITPKDVGMPHNLIRG